MTGKVNFDNQMKTIYDSNWLFLKKSHHITCEGLDFPADSDQQGNGIDLREPLFLAFREQTIHSFIRYYIAV